MTSLSINIVPVDGNQLIFQANVPQKLVGFSIVNTGGAAATINLYKQVGEVAIHILPKDLELSDGGQVIRSGDYIFLDINARLLIFTNKTLSIDLTFEQIS